MNKRIILIDGIEIINNVKRDFSINHKIELKIDNRISGAGMCFQNGKNFLIKINSKKILFRSEIYKVLFHEIGHTINDFTYSEESEYLAELFNYKCLIKYKKISKSNYLKYLYNWFPYLKKRWEIHHRAFGQLYYDIKNNIVNNHDN